MTVALPKYALKYNLERCHCTTRPSSQLRPLFDIRGIEHGRLMSSNELLIINNITTEMTRD